MARWDSSKKDKGGHVRGARGIDGAETVTFNKPGYLTKDFVPVDGTRSIASKVDRAQAVNNGFSGVLPSRDSKNRADRLASKFPTKVSGQRGVFGRGGQIVTKGRKSY